MTRSGWLLLAVPVVAPVMWFHWDTAYYIFGGDTPTWIAFQNLLDWHFPHLWDEFDGAGHPFANNAALPTAAFFWALWKLGVPTLAAQVAFFVALSALCALGIHRIGRLYLEGEALAIFAFVASLLYLLNTFGFYGENRRIFTTEFVVAYYLLPFFVSCLLAAIERPQAAVREALLAALASVALHNFDLVPAVSYVGVAWLAIAAHHAIFAREKGAPMLRFSAVFAAAAFVLAAYHLFAMAEYYRISSLGSDLRKIVQVESRSTADLLVRTLMFGAGGRELSAPLVVAYLLPIAVAVTAFFGGASRRLAHVGGTLLVVSLFLMDAGRLATRVFGLDETTALLYGVFRFPHIKFTAPYILAVSLLCGLSLARFRARKVLVAGACVAFVAAWNPRAFTTWMPIQLHRPDSWLELSAYLQRERSAGILARTLRLPSVEYFRDGVGGEEFPRTPPIAAEGGGPWMVHGAALGLLLPVPIFSLDMTTGARLNPCVRRIFREGVDPRELRALLDMLGIERVLVSRKYRFQNQFTPMATRLRLHQLLGEIELYVPHGEAAFANEGVELFGLATRPVPALYVAASAQRVSDEAVQACAFPPAQGAQPVAFHAGAPSRELAHALDRAPLARASVRFSRVAPGEYRARLAGLPQAGAVVLVLNDTYADWTVEAGGEPASRAYFAARRMPVNGFATAWVVDAPTLCAAGRCARDAAGGYDVDLSISYGPQRTYRALVFAALAAFAALAGLAAYPGWGRPGGKPAP